MRRNRPVFESGDGITIGLGSLIGFVWGLLAVGLAFNRVTYPNWSFLGVLKAVFLWPLWLTIAVELTSIFPEAVDSTSIFLLAGLFGAVAGTLVGLFLVLRS